MHRTSCLALGTKYVPPPRRYLDRRCFDSVHQIRAQGKLSLRYSRGAMTCTTPNELRLPRPLLPPSMSGDNASDSTSCDKASRRQRSYDPEYWVPGPRAQRATSASLWLHLFSDRSRGTTPSSLRLHVGGMSDHMMTFSSSSGTETQNRRWSAVQRPLDLDF